MELLQLKYFCSAAETQNFSQTAKIFLVPASNISQSIKRLENELGTKLFTRNANSIALNKKGQLFYSYIKNSLELIDTAKNVVRNKEDEGCIRINIHINRRVVMEVIEKFQKKYPKINIVVDYEIDKAVQNYDLTVTDRLINTSLNKVKAAQENIVLAYKKDFFGYKKKIDINSIKDKPFITMNFGNSLYEITQSICKEQGFEPRIAIQSNDPFYIRTCVELGLGIAFVPEFSWRGQFSEDVTLQKIGKYSRSIYLYTHPFQTEYLKNFYKLLKEAFSES